MISVGKFLRSVYHRLSPIQLQNNSSKKTTQILNEVPAILLVKRKITASAARNDLMEFFDDKKNWGESEVKVGRAWKLDELRIKSNSDLHKLWYILLKERNMLLTTEHECNYKMEVFPSPERKDKVEESMRNLETVVRERNRAYHLLETGETGERPGGVEPNQIGLQTYRKHTEHLIPKFANRKWLETHKSATGGYAVSKFLKLYREKLFVEKKKLRNRNRNHVMRLLRKNPNLNLDLLRERYPDVDIEKLLRDDKCQSSNTSS